MKAEMHNFSTWINNCNPEEIINYYSLLLISSGFGIESIQEKHFNPHGYTALFLLSESHFAVHTFPEVEKTYIELSSCVKGPFDKFIKAL